MASPALNKTFHIGNFVKDPELRYTPSGKAVCDFRLAINETRGDKANTIFLDFVAWDKTAENISAYMHKGDSIHIEGRVAVESWDDKESGKKMSRIKFVVDRALFLSSGGGSGSKQERSTHDRPRTASADKLHGEARGCDDGFGEEAGDIPF